MKITTITVLSNDTDADSAQRIYDQGEPDAVWQAFQALMTNPDNEMTFRANDMPSNETRAMSEERCPKCNSHTRNQLGTNCQTKPFRPIHYSDAHPWHTALRSASAAEEQFQYAGWREQIEARNTELATLRTQLEERNAQVAALIEGMDVIVQRYKPIAIQWLADHDAQVLRDAARACRAGKCGDPRCDHITCGTLEVAADRILELAGARASRLSAPKPDNSTGGLGQDGLLNQLEGGAAPPPKLKQG